MRRSGNIISDAQLPVRINLPQHRIDRLTQDADLDVVDRQENGNERRVFEGRCLPAHPLAVGVRQALEVPPFLISFIGVIPARRLQRRSLESLVDLVAKLGKLAAEQKAQTSTQ